MRAGFLARSAGRAGRFGLFIGLERMTRHRARSASVIPSGPTAVTREWFDHVLCSNFDGVHVTAFSSEAPSSGSTVRCRYVLSYNALGEAVRATSVGLRGGLPGSVFAKFTPSLRTRLAHSLTGTTVAEACFFNEFRPNLEIEAPWGYFAAADPRSGRSVQLMEDVAATQGATFCTPATEITRTDAEQMVTLLGTLHGTLHDDPRLTRLYRPIRTLPQWYAPVLKPVELQKYHERAMDDAAERIPASVRAARQAIWPRFLETIELNARLPRTLIHSDVHVSNWYRTADGRMGLGDWGCVAKGHGTRDLAYALSTALSIEDRRAWELDLIGLYLEAFRSRGGSPLSWTDTLDHYRQHLVGALLMWTPTLCHSPLLPDMQPREVSLTMIERITTALADHDVLRRQ